MPLKFSEIRQLLRHLRQSTGVMKASDFEFAPPKVSQKLVPYVRHTPSQDALERERARVLADKIERLRKINADRRNIVSEPAPKKQRIDPALHKQTRAKQLTAMNKTPEARKRSGELIQKVNADPTQRRASAKRMKQLHKDPHFAAAHLERIKKLNANPNIKAANTARLKKLFADPEFAERNRKASSEAQKKRWAAWRAAREKPIIQPHEFSNGKKKK